MPAPLNVDREAAKTLVIAVGVRQAARQLGIPEPTLLAWSARGKWLKQFREARQLAQQTSPYAPQSVAISPSKALQNSLLDDSKATRISLSHATRKSARYLERAKPREILHRHKALVSVATVAAKVHSWDSDKAAGGLTLNLAIVQGGMGLDRSQD